MKAILTYESYPNLGKQYQVKFIYEKINEAKDLATLVKHLNNKSITHI